MSTIPNNQGNIKQSEISVDQDLLSTVVALPIQTDSMTVLSEVLKTTADLFNRTGYLLTSSGNIGWDGSNVVFNSNNIVFKILSNLQGATVNLTLMGGPSPTTNQFHTVALADGQILYIEMDRSNMSSSQIIENAIDGGSVVIGKTARIATNLPAANSDESSGFKGTLCFPLALRSGNNLYWVPHGIFWPQNTTSFLGSVISTTVTPVGTIVPFHQFGNAMPLGNQALNVLAPGWYLCDGSVIIDQRSSFSNPTRNADGSPGGSFNSALDKFSPDLNGAYTDYNTLSAYSVSDKVVYQGLDYVAIQANGPVTIPSYSNLISVNLGTFVVKGSDGSAWAWGNNVDGQLGDNSALNKSSPVSVVGNYSFTKISAGKFQTAAINGLDGSAWTWGLGTSGQLGNNTITSKSSPVSVVGNYSYNKIVPADLYSVALQSDKSAWAWGNGANGQLGNNSITSKSSPVAVLTPNSYIRVTAGLTNAFAQRGDGQLFSWGRGTSGQLGDNTITNKSAPVSIATNTSYVQISAGDAHLLALRASDGSAWACGVNANGNLGINTLTDRSSPTSVAGNINFSRISAGAGHSLAIRSSDGSTWAWGNGTSGELGNNTLTDRSSPTSVLGNISYAQISAGNAFSVGINVLDGSAWAWGVNSNGKLGDNTITSKSSPVAVVGNISYARVAAGVNHAVAIRASDSSAWAWGLGTSGQLGNNTITSKSSPVSVVGNINFSQVSSGTDFSVGLKSSDGSAWSWGTNGSGQLGDGTLTTRSSPVSVLGGHSFINITAHSTNTIAVKADGSVWIWGDSSIGQLGNNQTTVDSSSPISVAEPTSYSDISTDNTAIVAIRVSDGSAWAWGLGNNGQIGDNTTNNRSSPVSVAGNKSYTKVSAGDSHMLAIRGSDKSAWAWGYNANGSLGNNTTNPSSSPVSVVGNRSYSKISGGYNYSLGLNIIDGSAWAWGVNGTGQLGDGTVTQRNTPVSVLGNHSFIDISAGIGRSIGVKIDGSVWVWGDGSTGNLGNNQTALNTSSPIIVTPAIFTIQPLPINPNYWSSDFSSIGSSYRRLSSNSQNYSNWDSITSYSVGSKVKVTNLGGTFNYVANYPNIASAPTGLATSNFNWSFDFESNNSRDNTFIKGSTSSPSDASGYNDGNSHQLTVGELASHTHYNNPSLNLTLQVQPFEATGTHGFTTGQNDDGAQTLDNFSPNIYVDYTGNNKIHNNKPRNFNATYIIKIF